MSEAAGERRFDPTPSRKERAKREGKVARSSEVVGIAAFGGGLVALLLSAPLVCGAAATSLRASARGVDVAGACALIALAFVPAVGAAAGACAASFAQTGGVRIVALTFAPQKLQPAAGLKRMFGGEAALGAARAAFAFAAVTAAIVPVIARAVGSSGGVSSPMAAALLARDGAARAAFSALAVGALFACADYAFARRRWIGGLRMSFDELKRDMKEQDGDPHARARRKQLHRSFGRGDVKRTREASFVVVNPTHIAIAVRYAPPAIDVPEILVRAAGDAALEVRAIALRERLPIVENVPLARLLFRTGAAGRAIPFDTFVAVAEVIAALVRVGALDV